MAKGDAVIPMSTDISTAALIAAAIESIDKVGPFQAKFALSGIDDIRAIKKKVIVDRAKKIVQEWATKTISEGEEMLKDVYDASKPGKLTAFGKAQLACGTGVFDSDWIILVEGRADVINLLRAGFDNAIAIEGAKIDETIVKLTEGKKVIAFLDGDRAGDLATLRVRDQDVHVGRRDRRRDRLEPVGNGHDDVRLEMLEDGR